MAGDAKRKGFVDAAVRVRELDLEVVDRRGQCHVASSEPHYEENEIHETHEKDHCVDVEGSIPASCRRRSRSSHRARRFPRKITRPMRFVTTMSDEIFAANSSRLS